MGTQSDMRRNFLWNTAGNLTYFACQWALTILAVRLAGVDASGIYNTALTVTNIFLSVASFGMYNFQVSDAQNKYAQTAYVKSRLYTCTLSVVGCLAFVALGALTGANPYTLTECVCIALVLLYRLVESVTDVYNAIDQKHGRLDIVGKTYAARGVISLVTFALGLRITHSMSITLFIMLVGNIAFFVAYTLPKALPFYTKTSVLRKTVFALLLECSPLAIYAVLNTTTSSIPKIILGRVLGTTALGIYSPVTAPELLLQVGASYLFTPFITVFSEHFSNKNQKRFLKAVGAVSCMILILLPVGLLIAQYIGRWGLRTFVSAHVEQYSYLLAPMVYAAILTALVLFFSMVLTVMRCMRGLIFANIIGIVVAATVSEPLITAFELQGTTYASIAALCAQLLCLIIVGVRKSSSHFADEPM
ncbi:MAG: lipopolysaccharide biosynthesis protein [Ruminococcaceae bacterium]|nr:lipopolysaccharide biosynthesis protein [Oscillospiraceae bacterium]